jgi:16S rRNA (guanine966-N2)-methyltransferase
MNTQKSVRVIAGDFKNQKLKVPRGFKSSPMGERQRQAIFNSLGTKLKDANVLDAFAGSGALGIEALSRGASFTQFVEKDGFTFAELKKNLQNAKISPERYGLRRSSAHNYLKNNQQARFDIIFVDPPYNEFKLKYVEDLALLVQAGGVMIVSSPPEEELPEEIEGLSLVSEKVMAGAKISFYQA